MKPEEKNSIKIFTSAAPRAKNMHIKMRVNVWKKTGFSLLQSGSAPLVKSVSLFSTFFP